MNRFILFLAFTQLVWAPFSYALKNSSTVFNDISRLPQCSTEPSFLKRQRLELSGGLEALPQGIFVGRKMELYLEDSKNSSKRLHAEQSFVSKLNTIHCQNGFDQQDLSISTVAPTLIDRTKKQEVGSSIWQFQTHLKSGELNLTSSRSNILSQAKPQDIISNSEFEHHVFQISHNRFEIVFVKVNQGIKTYMSITYDRM